MPPPPTVACRTIEFHRYGQSHHHILSRDNRYIRATGWDEAASEVSPNINHEDLLSSLGVLRYTGAETSEEILEARQSLATESARFLPPVQLSGGELLQIDLVTNAAELWAFPFEACFAGHTEWLEGADRGVVVTRRIRGEFAAKAPPWPSKPSVLFAHAPVTGDLERPLVQSHLEALVEALAPWARGKDPRAQGLLEVREVFSARDLAAAREAFGPAYVHLLAHGARMPADARLPLREIWGLRLGYEDEPGTAPADIALALQPKDGRPLVVTVAACDSANQSNPVFAVESVVQELHRRGIPVVVGSQLPLTKSGSTLLAKSFYACLLCGEDVRVALHRARVDLRASAAAGHDWLSLVGYVRLPPEGYAEHLREFGLGAQLGMLNAASDRADELSQQRGRRVEFDEVEQLLRNRLESLNALRRQLADRRDLLDECSGLQASAWKRLAELQFSRGLHHADIRQQDWQDSREALECAAECYRAAYKANLHNHWLGVQQLALEAALTGGLSQPADWTIVLRAAELARDVVPESGRLDYWSCGTLAELALLAPVAGQPRRMEMAAAAVRLLLERARADEKGAFAIVSTRRQMNRYVTWWTSANGFFPGPSDLAADARAIVELLS